MQFRAGGCVLQVDFFLREDEGRCAECGEGGFVETGEDEFLFAGIGVDIPHCENAGYAGLEFCGVDDELLALDFQPPFRDGAQFGRQAEKDEQHIERQAASDAVVACDLDHVQLTLSVFFVAADLADEELHLVLFAKGVHLRDGCGGGAKAVAAMNERDAFRLVFAGLNEVQRPVECRVAAAHDDQVFVGELRRVANPVEQLAAFEFTESVHLEGAGLKRAHPGGDEHGFGKQPGGFGGFHEEAAIGLAFQHSDFLPEVEGGAEGFDLLEQVVGQLLPGTYRHGGNVVNRFVGVEFDTLPARVSQGVDDVGLDLQQAELEHLEQADRARADDDGVRFNDVGRD